MNPSSLRIGAKKSAVRSLRRVTPSGTKQSVRGASSPARAAVILLGAAILLIVAPVASPTVGSGTAAATPNPLTCSGYPEHRIFLESQTWWITTPGLAGTNFGHMHVGACLPDRQHVSGLIGIDVRIILHDNPGTFDYFNPVLVSDTQEISLPHVMTLHGMTCSVATCSAIAHVDVDTSLLNFDGYEEIRIRAYTNTPDGNIMHSSINALPYVANGKPVNDLDRRAYERGKGWYTGSGYCEASFVSAIPTDAISGTWTPTVKIENHGDTDDLPVTHHTITIDPDFHAIPPVPGTIIVDGSGQLLQTTLSIDTTTLSNGIHRLHMRGDCDDPRGSTNSGVLVFAFNVDNGSSPPPPADFTLSASPASQSVKQGQSTSFSIPISRTNFASSVDLSVAGLPVGAAGVFSDDPTTASTSTLSIGTSSSGSITPVGTYPLTITAVGGGLTRTASATLRVTDGIGPTVSAPASGLYYRTRLGSTTTPVHTSWRATDSSGVVSYQLQRRVNTGLWTTVNLPSTTTTAVNQALVFGGLYTYRVRATDGQANPSAWVYGRPIKPLLRQQGSASVRYGGSWRTVFTRSASGGSLKYSTRAGAYARYTFSGSSVAWVAFRGPNRGSARVYIDGVYATTIGLRSSVYQSRAIVYARSWGFTRTHTIKIVVLGTRGHPRVDVDAFLRLYSF
jgi:hypothetical protein